MAAAPANPDAFRIGATVIHPQYGIGRITAIDGAGPKRKGTVAFTLGEPRTFVLSMAPLRLMDRTPGTDGRSRG